MTERPAGWATAAGLALDYADSILLRAARDVHNSVGGRVHGVVDTATGHHTIAHLLHDGIAEGVFGTIALGLRGAGKALLAADRALTIGPPMENSAHGRHVISALHGVIGDKLAERAPSMAFEMAVRRHGRDVAPTAGDLAEAFPEATGSLVVFLHGLCESEAVWHRRARPRRLEGDVEPGGYGERLAAEGWTPVYLRLNTGLSVAESGVALSALLQRLTENWPVPVRRIALVGHSMGGLIIRTAMAVQGESSWLSLVTDVVTLGTPHLGSPVEQGIARGMRVSERIPELAPYSRIFRNRSAGVLDLAAGHAAPPVEGVRYRLVAGSLSQGDRHVVALAIGDGLVQPRSAFGQPLGGPPLFPDAETLHVPGAHHFDLLNHDDVYAAIRRWLGSADADVPQLEGAGIVEGSGTAG